MQAAGTVLVLLWMAVSVIAIIALIRGHIDMFGLRTRKAAVLALLGAQVLVVAAGIILPKTPSSAPAAGGTSTISTPTTPTPTSTSTSTSTSTTIQPTTTTPPPAAPTTTQAPTTTVDAPPPPAPTSSNPATADIAYIAVLDENGVQYDSKDAAIHVGHTVCTARAAGNTETAIGMTIVNTGMYSAQDAGIIVGDAEAAYCPEFK